MIKQTINYTDLDGNEASTTEYFSITTEEMAVMRKEGFEEKFKRLSASEDPADDILSTIELITMAHKVRTEDGTRLVKDHEATEAFRTSIAFEAFVEKILFDEKSALAFIKGVFPSRLSANVSDDELRAQAESIRKGKAPAKTKK